MVTEIAYSKRVIELVDEIYPCTVFPISSSIDKEIIPGLLLCCDNEIFEIFNIREEIPNFDLQFRMVNNENSYVIEVALRFVKRRNLFSRRKVMRLHLNPVNKLVRYFMDKASKKEMMSFNIANQDTGELITSVSTLNAEKDWFERNRKIAKKLKGNNKYEELSLMIENKLMKKNETRFEFHDTEERELLIEYAKNKFKIKLE